MSDSGGKYYRRPANPGSPWEPDLSRIPAYVEPPRPRPAKPDRTSWRGILVIFACTALIVAGFVGFDRYAEIVSGPPALQRTAQMMPPVRMPVQVREVPLPNGLSLPPPPTSAAQPRSVSQVAHPTRLARPSNG